MNDLAQQFASLVALNSGEQSVLAVAQEEITLTFPTERIEFLRALFEKETQFDKSMKSVTVAGNSLFAANPIFFNSIISAAAPTTSSMALTSAFILYGIVGSAILGNNIKRLADGRIYRYADFYDTEIEEYRFQMQVTAEHYARKNYVSELNGHVISGGTISIAQLAKLVNIDDAHFQLCCDKLSLTVRETKMMLANQNEEDAADITPQDTPVYRTQWAQTQSPEANNVSWTTKNVLCALHNYFIDGIAGHARVFQKPKADDHLPPLEAVTVTIAPFPFVPDLAERIERYGVGKLNLPALEPMAFR